MDAPARRSRLLRCLVAAMLLAATLAPGPARADDASREFDRFFETPPPRQRGGWVVGGNLGWAVADLDLRGSTSLDTGWQGGGTSGKVRVGHMVRESVLVGLEYGVWRRKEELADGTSADTEDRYLGVGSVLVRVYPGLEGIYTHMTLGWGSAWLKAGEGDSFVQTTGNGLAATVGVGYELWIDDDITVGGQVEVGALDADDGVGGGFAFFTLTANLYFAGR